MEDAEFAVQNFSATGMKRDDTRLCIELAGHVEELTGVGQGNLARIIAGLSPVPVGIRDVTGSGNVHEAHEPSAPSGGLAMPACDRDWIHAAR